MREPEERCGEGGSGATIKTTSAEQEKNYFHLEWVAADAVVLNDGILGTAWQRPGAWSIAK